MFDPMLTTKRILGKLGGNSEIKTLTYKGNGGGVELFGDGNLYAKIHDGFVDIDTLSKLVLMFRGTETVPDKEYYTVGKVEDTDNYWTIASAGGTLLAFQNPSTEEGVDIGVYVLTNPDFYVKSMTFETIVPIDPKFLPPMGGIEVFNLPDYGIDLLSMLMNGHTELEHDNTALITDISNAITASKVPAVHIDDMLSDAIITSFYLDGNVDFSMVGNMGGWIRVDVIINDKTIRMFKTALGA